MKLMPNHVTFFCVECKISFFFFPFLSEITIHDPEGKHYWGPIFKIEDFMHASFVMVLVVMWENLWISEGLISLVNWIVNPRVWYYGQHGMCCSCGRFMKVHITIKKGDSEISGIVKLWFSLLPTGAEFGEIQTWNWRNQFNQVVIKSIFYSFNKVAALSIAEFVRYNEALANFEPFKKACDVVVLNKKYWPFFPSFCFGIKLGFR